MVLIVYPCYCRAWLVDVLMKGVKGMGNRLKDKDRVSVICGEQAIYFNRRGGVWINHVPEETQMLDDAAMDKLLSNYEEFGYGVIWHEEDLHTNSVDLAGFLMIPEETHSVVVEYAGGKKIAYFNKGPLELPDGKVDIVFASAGTMMNLTSMRSAFPVLIEKGVYKSVTCYDAQQKPIQESGKYKK